MTGFGKSLTRAAGVALALGFATSSSIVGAETICVNPDRASCEPTIQLGIDAASPGDTVKVSSGVYFENVIIATPGVTLKGGKSAILDPTFPGTCSVVTTMECYQNTDCPGSGGGETCDNIGNQEGVLVDNVADVTLKGFTIRNGQSYGVELDTAPNATVSGMNFIANGSTCIYGDGTSPGQTIEGNSFFSCDSDCVYLSGTHDDADVSKNKMRQCDGYGIDISGDGVISENNTVFNVDGNGIYISGDNSEVGGNKVDMASSEAVYISGNGGLVTGNRLTNTADSAVYLNGDNGIVTKNKIRNVSGDYAIDFSGSGGEISKNSIRDAEETGIDVDCDSCTTGTLVEKNNLRNVGTDDYEGIDANTGTASAGSIDIIKNKLRNVGYHGIDIRATAGAGSAMILGNSVRSAGRNGDNCFDLADSDLAGYTIEGNSARDCGGNGFEIDGTGHLVAENKVKNTAENGIELDSSSVDVDVDSNKISGAAHNGVEIELGATGAIVQDNTIKGNRVDVCDEAAGSTILGNKPSKKLTTETALCADL